ncbi:GreA/GreB family elongation factor [Crocinitomix catalasitica]|uniref:GreA/GreB family elongation factor n=1 Tax=Crocinitomix catalasitica TaxID=184607 RepID=UPI000486E34D|nr:GreA/GreB family elongation factor [Crocinitomix catalasitica]
MSANIKPALYQHCFDYVNERVKSIQDALASSQESANSETKSTAGDKHDTARAMMQLDVEQKSKQLAEAQKLHIGLRQIKPDQKQTIVQLGAVVSTNLGSYYIAISIGKVDFEGQSYFVISPGSPIGQALFGKKKGDTAEFNGRNITIENVQ